VIESIHRVLMRRLVGTWNCMAVSHPMSKNTFFKEIIRIRRLDFDSVSIEVAGTIDNFRKMDS
jgi:hypothetical protein